MLSMTAIAMLLRPFVAFAVMALVLIPIRLAVMRWWPDGQLKRLLLRPIGKKRGRR